MARRSRLLCATSWPRIAMIVAIAVSLLVAAGVERLSYKWCPWMGAMWTTPCDRGGEHEDEGSDAPAVGRRCCETRGFEALPPGNPSEAREPIVAASAPAATPLSVSFASVPLTEIALVPSGGLLHGGVPPPTRQRRLAMISVLRL